MAAAENGESGVGRSVSSREGPNFGTANNCPRANPILQDVETSSANSVTLGL